jgi:hypothetical protein
MPTRRLRKRLLDHLLGNLRVIGEVGLASLVTLGVVTCGGIQTGVIPDAAPEGADGTEAGEEGHVTIDGPAFPEGGVFESAEAEPIDEGICDFCDAGEGGFEAGDDGDDGGDADDAGFPDVVFEGAKEAGGHH